MVWYFGCPRRRLRAVFPAARESVRTNPGSENLCVYSTPPAVNFMSHRSLQKGASRGMITPLWAGADAGTRTPNLMITRHLLCRLSYIGLTAPVRNPRFIGAGRMRGVALCSHPPWASLSASPCRNRGQADSRNRFHRWWIGCYGLSLTANVFPA